MSAVLANARQKLSETLLMALDRQVQELQAELTAVERRIEDAERQRPDRQLAGMRDYSLIREAKSKLVEIAVPHPKLGRRLRSQFDVRDVRRIFDYLDLDVRLHWSQQGGKRTVNRLDHGVCRIGGRETRFPVSGNGVKARRLAKRYEPGPSDRSVVDAQDEIAVVLQLNASDRIPIRDDSREFVRHSSVELSGDVHAWRILADPTN